MNFTDFANDLKQEFDIPEYKGKKILAFLNKKMEEKLFFGTEMTFRNIGTITIKIREPKKYLHFKSKTMRLIPRRFVLQFRMTRIFKERLKAKTVYGYSNSQTDK